MTPVTAYAQTLEPRKAAAGTDIAVTLECKADKPPVIVLDKREIAGTGTTPKWRFKLPVDVEAKTYAVKWKCGPTEAGKEADLGQLEVTRAPTAPAQQAVGGDPRVIGVSNVTKGNNGIDPPTQLKDVLKIRVQNLKEWQKVEKNARTPLNLVLAGTVLKNVVAVPTSSDSKDGPDVSALLARLEVHNARNDKEGVVREAWVQTLQTAHRRAGNEIEVTLAPQDQALFISEETAKIALEVYPGYTWIVVAFLALVAIALVVLGKITNLLRDSNGATNPPYSLAKHQMALWFVVVVGAYLFVWLMTGQFSTISKTALILIGISGATGLMATTMDAGKRTNAAKTRAELEAERDALARTLNDPVTGLQTQLRAAVPGSPEAAQLTAAITPKLARLQEVNALLTVPPPVPETNRQWVQDLLSDDNGISFHRFQMAIWTLVLVAVFVRAVYDDILMPEFDATLLGLLGISGATYLGFKFPEKAS